MVDDNKELNKVMAEILQLSADVGEVLTLSEPKVAQDLIMNDTFDLVITDYSMPGMTGSELVRAVRNSGNQVRIIMFSVCMDENVFMQFELNEIQGAIPKNSPIDLVHKAVHEVLNNRPFFRFSRAS